MDGRRKYRVGRGGFGLISGSQVSGAFFSFFFSCFLAD